MQSQEIQFVVHGLKTELSTEVIKKFASFVGRKIEVFINQAGVLKSEDKELLRSLIVVDYIFKAIVGDLEVIYWFNNNPENQADLKTYRYGSIILKQTICSNLDYINLDEKNANKIQKLILNNGCLMESQKRDFTDTTIKIQTDVSFLPSKNKISEIEDSILKFQEQAKQIQTAFNQLIQSESENQSKIIKAFEREVKSSNHPSKIFRQVQIQKNPVIDNLSELSKCIQTRAEKTNSIIDMKSEDKDFKISNQVFFSNINVDSLKGFYPFNMGVEYLSNKKIRLITVIQPIIMFNECDFAEQKKSIDWVKENSQLVAPQGGYLEIKPDPYLWGYEQEALFACFEDQLTNPSLDDHLRALNASTDVILNQLFPSENN